ncbi:hypothetical protein N7520_001816 [Penicillium odoratum]|uniref:uncharacterized protein n=1 Tax=Penicillium odoratum TaxID=1167516 RepID=UPI002549BDD9|nr:uncharacterized protein N7520_001816 [Penicillium odoratum]KAJ5778570.1 hypothetical protein N7520_001816 [Penicillium odoratum]
MILYMIWGILVLITSASSLQASSDGICYTYTVEASDTCESIASAFGITKAEIETYNGDTWGWKGCDSIYQGDFICLSSGDPPMPVAFAQAICGPQVPGTARPDKYSALSSLNPCPTNECCITGGQCVATSSDSCSSSKCISNCETASTKTTSIKSTSTSTKTSSMRSTSTTEHTSSTKTTTTAGPTGTGLWTLAAYTGYSCDGDYYFIMGNSLVDNECLSLHGGLSVGLDMTNGVTCGYYTNDGAIYTDCDSSPSLGIWSWDMTGGSCTAYEDGCGTSDGNSVEISSATGCQVEEMFNNPHYEINWGSVKCSVA